MIEFARQNRLTVTAEPLVEQRGVDAAEVDRVPEIAAVEVVELRVVADRPARDRRPGDEHARRGTMIGPAAAVLFHPPSELGEGHQYDPLIVLGFLELGEQLADGLTELPQEVAVTVGLAGVRVEAVK